MAQWARALAACPEEPPGTAVTPAVGYLIPL